MKLRAGLLALLLALLATTPAHGAWRPDGVPNCGTCGIGEHFYDPHVAPAGQGGAFVTWWNGAWTLRVQRLTPGGDYDPAWPPGGVSPTTLIGENWSARLVPDDAGGVYVVWLATGCVAHCLREPGLVYVQRLTATGGLAPGWPVDGVQVSARVANRPPPAVPDGQGGLIVALESPFSNPAGPHVYLQRVDASGAELWNAYPDGVPVAPSSPGTQTDAALVADGAGGAFVAWQDVRPAYADANIFVQRVDAAGVPLVAAGRPVVTEPGAQADPAIAFEGGQVFVAWADPRDGTGLDLHVRKYDGALLPQWSDDCGITCLTAGDQMEPALLPDGAGGVFAAWSDARAGQADIYVTRLDASGGAVPPWPADGMALGATSRPAHRPELVTDGAGGVFVAWNSVLIFATHLSPDGSAAPGWQAGGTAACEGNCGGTFGDYFLVPDEVGGALVTWQETRMFQAPYDADQSFTQRLVPDGVVAVAAALVSADAGDGRVRVEWQLYSAAGDPVTVQRDAGDGWREQLAVTPDPQGRVRFEDADVTPGQRYGYRLRLGSGGAAGEVWLEIPTAAAFAIESVRPNPGGGELTLAFALPSPAPARIEVLDVAGRRLRVTELEAPAAGRHVLALSAARPLPPGLYLVRLVQAGRAAVARACVVR